jgi:hypothetical protein
MNLNPSTKGTALIWIPIAIKIIANNFSNASKVPRGPHHCKNTLAIKNPATIQRTIIIIYSLQDL